MRKTNIKKKPKGYYQYFARCDDLSLSSDPTQEEFELKKPYLSKSISLHDFMVLYKSVHGASHFKKKMYKTNWNNGI